MALLLIEKIVSLFLIMFAGALLVKLKLLKSSDSRVLSLVLLYLLTPCVILTSFQVEPSPQVRAGLALAFLAAVIIHILLITANALIRRPLRLDPIEQTSIFYSNSGNLIIPLVTAILGPEWVIYTSAFIAVQQVLMWSHAKSIICGERGFDIRRIYTNINMLSILAGIILFVTGLRFPGPIDDAITSLGGLIGPVSMLVTGLLIGGMDIKKLLSYKRLLLITPLRLIAVPLMVFMLLRFSGIVNIVENGRDVLMITFLATTAPSASTITNMAVVYGKDADYASAINVATTLLCIATMPLMIALYTM